MQTEAARGPRFSLGAILLAEEIKTRGLSLADIGRALSTDDRVVGRHIVCRWLSGQRPMSLDYAVKLNALYGVPIPSWTQPPPKRRSRKDS